MDLDTLFRRPNIARGPISLLARLSGGSDGRAQWRRARELLAGRDQNDELVLLSAWPRPDLLPAQDGRLHIRWIHEPEVTAGAAWSHALVACRRPLIITVDEAFSLDQRLFQALIALAGDIDFVAGYRPDWRLTRPLDALLRGLIATPVRDPLCPIRALRREAVAGIVLEAAEPLVFVELAAKLSYLVSLVDEVAVPPLPGPRGVAKALISQPSDLAKLLIAPQFWRFEPAAGFRPRSYPATSVTPRESTRNAPKASLATFRALARARIAPATPTIGVPRRLGPRR